ncbi:hypothetical protein B0H63DRAFT_30224 [Podospora didyma]|uniref:Uncharacterized protein n=1 Tax=Podospora didyma TaxID=330526 RepID=A0AAE0P5W3_9PEZI|nr:hypothetical protein B0H63DRAFT_30224 [Podospora didyma]
MASFDPVEFWGIATGRDIVFRHETAGQRRGSTSSSTISFSSVDVDEDIIALTPWFSPASLLSTPKAALGSPASSFVNLSPDAHLVQSDGVHFDSVDEWRLTPTLTSETLPPLDRFVAIPERHEKLALALSPNVQCAQPFYDYIPCPGSGPGSAAASTARRSAKATADSAFVVDEPAPTAGPATLQHGITGLNTAQVDSAQPNTTSPSTMAGRSPLSRYLASGHPHEWLAVVLQQPSDPARQLDLQQGLSEQLPAEDVTARSKRQVSSGSSSGSHTIGSDYAEPNPTCNPLSAGVLEARPSTDISLDSECTSICSIDTDIVVGQFQEKVKTYAARKTGPRFHRESRKRHRHGHTHNQNKKAKTDSTAEPAAGEQHDRPRL